MIENNQAVQRAILFMSKEKGGRGRRSIEEDSIQRDQEIKAAVRLYINRDPAIAMVREFEEILDELGHSKSHNRKKRDTPSHAFGIS